MLLLFIIITIGLSCLFFRYRFKYPFTHCFKSIDLAPVLNSKSNNKPWGCTGFRTVKGCCLAQCEVECH